MNEPNSVIIQTKKGKKLKRQIPITLGNWKTVLTINEKRSFAKRDLL